MQPSPNPIDSIDLDELLQEAMAQLAVAKQNSEQNEKRCAENVAILESVVRRLSHIKDRRLRDSDIIH
jgi:hypothetical protein